MPKLPDARHPGLWGLGAAALTAAAGGLLLQRRHLAQIRSDPDYALLENPPRGRPLGVTSRDGTRLHAEVFGAEDGATVVLAHGWTEALQYWVYLLPLLTERGLRVVAFDLRGHGHSEPAAGGDYKPERFGEDLEAVLAAVVGGAERAVVVGHSLGAMSIVAWAAEHDARARASAAVLCNTGVEGLIGENVVLPLVAGRLKEAAGRLFMAAPGSLPRVSTPLTFAGVRRLAFGPDGTPAQIAFYERMLWECSPRVRSSVGVSLASLDLGEALPRLDVPTRVVAGSEDRLTPPSHARRIAERLPESRGVVELPRTGHMAPLERPREVADAILASFSH